MIPRLYPAGTTAFANEGLGALTDCISCIVSAAVNGVPEINISYPISGLHASEIAERCVIVADQDVHLREQPFVVKTIDKATPGIMTIYGIHAAVDAVDSIALEAYEAASLGAAISGIPSHATETLPVTITSQIVSSRPFSHAVPTSVKQALGGMEGSILDTYGGEWEFDGFAITLKSALGSDNGVVIRYGKNLASLDVNADWTGVYTGVYPFWANRDTGAIKQLTPPVVSLGTFSFSRVFPLNVSADYETEPTDTQLIASAQEYASANRLTAPKVSWKVVMKELRASPEYANVAPLEAVSLGDTVTIYYPDFGANASARVVSERFDVIREQYTDLTIGSVRASLASTIASQAEAVSNAVKTVEGSIAQAIKSATEAITGNTGGYVVTILNADGQPQELLVMDTPDITTAQNVWRWNVSGLGYSSTGYNGPYATAITADGKIVADFITAGTLDASLINVINLVAHQLQATNGTNVLNINGYSLDIKDGSDHRVWLPTTGNQQGSLFLYGGSRPNASGAYNDQGTDATSYQSYFNSTGMTLGQDYQGKATGTLTANRINLSDGGVVYIYDANGNVISRVTGSEIVVNTGDITAYNGTVSAQDGTRTRAVMRGQSGNIQMYDSNGQERVGLYPAEPQIAMYNASGSRIGRWRPDLDYSGSVSAGTSVPCVLEDGEAAMIMYTADSSVPSSGNSANISLQVNGADAAYASYTYAGSENNYASPTYRILTYAGSGTFVGWIAVHNGTVEVWGSGRRGTTATRGDTLMTWAASSVQNITFSAAGTVRIKHIAM